MSMGERVYYVYIIYIYIKTWAGNQGNNSAVPSDEIFIEHPGFAWVKRCLAVQNGDASPCYDP